MLKIITSIVIVALFSNGFVAYAQTKSPSEIKLKRQIVECGTNQNVKIKLNSNETLEGRIAEIRNDSLTLQLVDAAGQVISRDLAYSELNKVSKVGGAKAGSALKRGMLYGVGFYVGGLAVAAAVIGIVSAASR